MSTPQDDRRATEASDAQVDEIVSRGPAGAFAVAGIATAIVVAIYFAFYFFVFPAARRDPVSDDRATHRTRSGRRRGRAALGHHRRRHHRRCSSR